MIDVEEFKYRMAVARMTMPEVATLLGISKQALYKRFSTGAEWSTADFYKICDAFNLSSEDARAIFDVQKVG